MVKVVDLSSNKPDAEIGSDVVDNPRYPWGTEMHLDHETLSAVEAANGELPDVGKNVHILAHGKVTAKEMSADGKRKSARVQITHMGHEDPEAAGKGAKALYPSAEDNDK